MFSGYELVEHARNMALEQLTAMIAAQERTSLHFELGICRKFLDSCVSELGK